MQVKKILPVGWPCTLVECPPGYFIVLEYPDMLCFKSEYEQNNRVDAYNCAGEYLTTKGDDFVQPVEMIVEREEV